MQAHGPEAPQMDAGIPLAVAQSPHPGPVLPMSIRTRQQPGDVGLGVAT